MQQQVLYWYHFHNQLFHLLPFSSLSSQVNFNVFVGIAFPFSNAHNHIKFSLSLFSFSLHPILLSVLSFGVFLILCVESGLNLLWCNVKRKDQSPSWGIEYIIVAWLHNWYGCLFKFMLLFHANYHSLFPFFFFITTQKQCSQCTITFQCFTYHLGSWISNIVIYLFH